ncbi:MAG: BtrH N-terminal domain-containing protein [Deltaproteobacteria bacterium]
MKKVINNWVHIPGLHCGSVTLRDIMTYYGYPWSEPMCFGVGGGLGFYYSVRENLSPTRMIFVRGPGMESAFFSLTVKPTTWKHARKNSIDTVKKLIDRGVPVIIQTDIFYLDYYNSSTHFPGHIVSVWGYDDEKGTMLVADNHFEGLKEVPYDAFESGMASKDPSNPLDNNYMDIVPDRGVRPLEEVISEAIRSNALKMLRGTKGGRGESGVRMIKLWSDDLPNWKEAPDWKWCARFGYQVIKKRGVGGAGFRWIYRDFLIEAEDMIPPLKELGLSRKMDLIGNRWSDAAMVLKNISEREHPSRKLLHEASGTAHELWELESDFYETVLEKVN